MKARVTDADVRAAEDRARGLSYAAIASRSGVDLEEARDRVERGLPELRDSIGTNLTTFLRRLLHGYEVLAYDAQLEYERATTSTARQAALRLRQSALTEAADLAVRSGLLPRIDVWGAPDAAERALEARARLQEQLAELVRDPETPDHIREQVRSALAAYDADTAELLTSLRKVSGER